MRAYDVKNEKFIDTDQLHTAMYVVTDNFCVYYYKDLDDFISKEIINNKCILERIMCLLHINIYFEFIDFSKLITSTFYDDISYNLVSSYTKKLFNDNFTLLFVFESVFGDGLRKIKLNEKDIEKFNINI